MEAALSYDFSRVRVHTDAAAASAADALGARAYTVGTDIVFDPDAYAPLTTDGQRLLAHELAHVVQQADTTPSSRVSDWVVSDPFDALEGEAAAAATAVSGGQSMNQVAVAPAPATATTSVQRQIDLDDIPSTLPEGTAPEFPPTQPAPLPDPAGPVGEGWPSWALRQSPGEGPPSIPPGYEGLQQPYQVPQPSAPPSSIDPEAITQRAPDVAEEIPDTLRSAGNEAAEVAGEEGAGAAAETGAAEGAGALASEGAGVVGAEGAGAAAVEGAGLVGAEGAGAALAGEGALAGAGAAGAGAASVALPLIAAAGAGVGAGIGLDKLSNYIGQQVTGDTKGDYSISGGIGSALTAADQGLTSLWADPSKPAYTQTIGWKLANLLD